MIRLAGILNVTPDSFSDGGAYADPASAQARYAALADAGADLIDIGAESTRPGARLLDAAEEWARLAPVLEGIVPRVPVSIDTRHAATAAKALAWGACVINDQSALADPAMGGVLADAECRIVVMHTLGLPADPSRHWAADTCPVAELLRWKQQVTERAERHGIAPERLVYDPGIGFGKTPLQSLALLRRAPELLASGGDWMYGHSRKSFLRLFTDAPAAGRDRYTLAFSQWLAHAGVQYLRVHAVAEHRQALCI